MNHKFSQIKENSKKNHLWLCSLVICCLHCIYCLRCYISFRLKTQSSIYGKKIKIGTPSSRWYSKTSRTFNCIYWMISPSINIKRLPLEYNFYDQKLTRLYPMSTIISLQSAWLISFLGWFVNSKEEAITII